MATRETARDSDDDLPADMIPEILAHLPPKYLPVEMIAEILARLPPKYLLRSRTVCKAWRDLATEPDFILKHHSHQPTQPLITSYAVGPLKADCLEAVDLTTNKRRVVLRVIQRVPRPLPLHFADHGRDRREALMVHEWRDVCDALMVHGSCDGLLLLNFGKSLFVCNPATRQGARLPLLLQDDLDVLGFYKDADSGEYRLLYHQAERLGLSYYVLTVGS
ncbi:F-box/kelch-repeat protein At3g23880-like [Hordeum vulgare subsp. vulgare]|uniref:F-box domain-containing protein n=1 Tax=Hordeum vulgare subsp. vulgare TaxID=112509 RepID=A0A8I6Y8I9_HORVV|nr:F-box/kelch-repeat protein At3g23880-like [Hordeum vulgare subsp. vulgare]